MAADPSKVLGDDWQLSEADRAELARPERHDVIRQSVIREFRQGVWGWVDDDLGFVRPWGFDVAEIRVPISVSLQRAHSRSGAVAARRAAGRNAPNAAEAHRRGTTRPPGRRRPRRRTLRLARPTSLRTAGTTRPLDLPELPSSAHQAERQPARPSRPTRPATRRHRSQRGEVPDRTPRRQRSPMPGRSPDRDGRLGLAGLAAVDLDRPRSRLRVRADRPRPGDRLRRLRAQPVGTATSSSSSRRRWCSGPSETRSP